MITLLLEITEANGITVNLTQQDKHPTATEKLFAAQMGRTIADFLNQAPKSSIPANENRTNDHH